MLSRWPFKKAQDLQIRVVYPTGAHELFPLLVPKNDLDEYCPSDDLLNLPTIRSQERYLPEPGGSATTKIPLLDASLNLSSKPLLKELAKTIQLNNRPEFLEQLGWYNWVIKSLVEGKEIGQQIGSFVGMLQGVWETI
ncbi:Nucleosomal histone H3-Lys79 methylase [Puccinia graminis f. sp. tritici]|uniref:Nucleosomal histone H3-Lys79 methylase n=1 Tax=Puccinia graminis f. sp. tritici TaxID=56615 RepID=A0A5B0QW63_PUCGR|nr:Nucleosomal histone H3-Lys79 methylase [Puccinia graminis f. sp. tritici]